MIIFNNNKSTEFCQFTLRIKRFIHKRKVVNVFPASRCINIAIERTYTAYSL